MALVVVGGGISTLLLAQEWTGRGQKGKISKIAHSFISIHTTWNIFYL